ncbi:MAG: sulfite exporter TauE/SafE family protein [Armatimonadota bacterium]
MLIQTLKMEILAYFLILLTGVSFGLIGAGGAIVSVPILVYMLGQTFEHATGYSLGVSVLVSGVGTVMAANQKVVDFKKAFEFGIPTAVMSFLTRYYLNPLLPAMMFGIPRKSAMMFAFAVILVMAGVAMIRSKKYEAPANPHPITGICFGLGIGLISGIFGIGGGFMIVPVLAIFFGLDMKVAVGTSLCAVVMITSLGFGAEYLNHPDIPWAFVARIMASAGSGMVIGSLLRKVIDGSKLKAGFGYFILVLSVALPILEIVRLRSHG